MKNRELGDWKDFLVHHSVDMEGLTSSQGDFFFHNRTKYMSKKEKKKESMCLLIVVE